MAAQTKDFSRTKTRVSSQQLASLLDLTISAVTQLKLSGVIESVGKGVNAFELETAVPAYVKHLRSRRGKKEPTSLEEAEAKARVAKLEAVARRENIRTEMLSGTVVRVQDAKEEIIQMILAVKGALLSLPTRLAPRLLAKESETEVLRLLRDEVERALTQLSEIDWRNVRERNVKLREFVTLQNEIAGRENSRESADEDFSALD